MTTITNLDTAHVSQSARHRVNPHRAVSLASFNRPDDALAYLAGDVVGDDAAANKALVFPNCAAMNGGGGRILRASLAYEQTVMANFELYLFDQEPTNFADNAPLALVTGDLVKLIGVINLDDADKLNVGTGLEVYRASLVPTDSPLFTPFSYVCEATSRNLYALLVTQSAFTPASGTKVHLRLGLELD